MPVPVVDMTPSSVFGVNGRRHWLRLAAWGVLLLGAGIAAFCVMTSQRAHAFDVVVSPLGAVSIVSGLTLLAVAAWDRSRRAELRRIWARRQTPAWHADPAAPLEGYRRNGTVGTASRWWETLLRVLNWSCLAALLLGRLVAPQGAYFTVLAASFVASKVVLLVFRRARGRVLAELCLPRGPLAPGASGRLDFRIEMGAADLPIEAFSFALRCRRGSKEVVARIAPSASAMDPGRQPRWELTFDVPAGAPASDLLAAIPVRWQFVVAARGPLVRYRDEFYVPVFAARETPVTP
jgi:hypothetical protein